MCGLVGVLLFPKARPPEERRAILDITTSNLLANEERGKDAAGLAVIQRDGQHKVFKQPVTASTLVQMLGYHQALASVGPETVCILGHTRSPTKGSRWQNVNNHPLVSDHVIGIHNGHIRNDDALFAALKLPRRGEVDSEIIFRLQETVEPGAANGTYCAAIRQRANLLDGRFATLSVDLREPTHLLVLKHLRPLCLHYEAPLQALFFSSRYVFLRRSFGRSVITEALDSGSGFCFDALTLPEGGSNARRRFALAPGTADPLNFSTRPNIRST